MPLLFQPSPPPCIRCGTTTVLTPAFEEGQRVFVVQCPACGRAGTYTLDYSALASPITGPPQLAASRGPFHYLLAAMSMLSSHGRLCLHARFRPHRHRRPRLFLGREA